MPRDDVRLTLPAVPEYARIARLTAAGLAARCNFTYDEVEDLRIALGEVCSMLLGGGEQGTVEFTFGLDGDAVVLDATRQGGRAPVDGDLGEPDDDVDPDMSAQILAAVVDEFRRSDDGTTVHLRKQHVED